MDYISAYILLGLVFSVGMVVIIERELGKVSPSWTHLYTGMLVIFWPVCLGVMLILAIIGALVVCCGYIVCIIKDNLYID